MDRRERRRIEMRQRLERAAMELMVEHPLEDISVKDITDRADVASTTFYAHFDTKEQLAESLRVPVREEFTSAVAQCLFGHSDPLVALAMTAGAVFAEMDRDPVFVRLALNLRDDVDAFGGPVDSGLAAAYDRLIETGVVPEPRNRQMVVMMVRESVRAALRRHVRHPVKASDFTAIAFAFFNVPAELAADIAPQADDAPPLRDLAGQLVGAGTPG